MKLLQLNIWGGKLGKQIKEILLAEQPDIVCFQEAIQMSAGGDMFFPSIEQFQLDGVYPHTYFSPTFGFAHMNQIARWGNGILSRVPFLRTDTSFTRLEYLEPIDFDGDYNIRNFQHVAIEHEGVVLNVLNHHGHHVHQHKNGDEETMRQCKQIADYVTALDGDVVLAGDFNLAPHSESLEQLNAILVNHCVEAAVTTTRTPLTHKTEVCDYIFTSPGLATQNFRVLPDIASDHSALVIEF